MKTILGAIGFASHDPELADPIDNEMVATTRIIVDNL
jgi:hypothetical protein